MAGERGYKMTTDITKTVANFYDKNVFPGRFVRVLNMTKSFKRTILVILLKYIAFSKKNRAKTRKKYLNILKREPEKILDPACGTGDHICLVALAFPNAKVVAGDLSKNNLHFARLLCDLLEIKNLTFFSSNLMSSDFNPDETKFDLIICSGAIHHLSDPVIGMSNIARFLNVNGRLLMGLYGTSFFQEEYILRTLTGLFGNLNFKDKLKLSKDLGIDRKSLLLRNVSKKTKLMVYINLLRGRGIGYRIFPHLEDSIQLDGFWHPCVKYYNPDSLFEDIASAGMDIESINDLVIPKNWELNPYFNKLNFKDKFRLLDACFLVSYSPICKLK